jgi:hypothetical protein
MGLDRSSIGNIVKSGWQNDARQSESVSELFDEAVRDMRNSIQNQDHLFLNDDGSVDVPDAWVKGNGGDYEAAKKEIQESQIAPFRFHQQMLLDALAYVEYTVIPALDSQLANANYLNQVGGAFNYVSRLVLDRVADTVAKAEHVSDLLDNFTGMFFHVSGWEYFVMKAQRRILKEKGE